MSSRTTGLAHTEGQSTADFSAAELKQKALQLGFAACGIAPALNVADSDANHLHQWTDHGNNAQMAYMERNEHLRTDPRQLLEGARSVVALAVGYYPRQLLSADQLQFALYAYGNDYHDVLRAMMRELCRSMQWAEPDEVKICCDTVPMLDRYWAQRAGLGWIGHNTCLVTPNYGSYVFLAEIITTHTPDNYDVPLPSRCGACHRCVDSCPTHALQQQSDGRTMLDARRCLSYLTIESRDELPPFAAQAMGNYIYGCDRCQKACPHNRHPHPTDITAFAPDDRFLAMTPEAYVNMDEALYRQLFRRSAVRRAKFDGLRRNIEAIKKQGPSRDESCPKI